MSQSQEQSKQMDAAQDGKQVGRKKDSQKNARPSDRKKRVFRGLSCTCAGILAVFAVGSTVAENYKSYIDGALGTVSTRMEDKDGTTSSTADLYTYTTQYKSSQEIVDADKALGTRVAEEGTVLLKNENNALPLSSTAKVSLLGNGAYEGQLGGAIGSAPADNSALGYPKVQLDDALAEVGMSINPNLQSAFETWIPNTAQGPASGSFWLGMNFAPVSESVPWQCVEPTLDTLEENTSGCTSDYGDYTDAAIVVLSRVNAEGSNMIPGDVVEDDFTESTYKNPLSLADKEKALIKNAKEHANKVIVVLNANNPLEISELNEKGGEYEADAIVWIGTPGVWGMRGVANVLCGNASPSGKTVDTFAVNSALAPSAINTGIRWYSNSDETVAIPNGTEYMTYTYDNDTGSPTSLRAVAYEVDAEGIYTGYKYYETRYYDTQVDNGLGDHDGAVSSAGAINDSWNYDDEVSYSFGYGESYADFTQELKSVDVDLANKTVTAEVEVTRSNNDGYDGDAMDVVELYVQSPYTQYDVDNKVEKAAIQLLDYGKTQPLAPGESETITFTTDMKYMASYDYTNAKTYILDDGDYYFAIGNGAHDALNNVMAAQGVDVDGDASLAREWTNDTFDSTTFSTSENGTKITNQLDDADLNYWQPGTLTYLTRSDWDGTWPVAFTAENGKQLSITDNMIEQLRNRTYTVQHDDSVTTTWGQDNGLTLSSLKNASWDDERWQQLIEEITIEEAIEIIERGGGTTETLQSIQNPRAPQSDGPNGFNGSSIGQNTSTVVANDGTVITIADDDPNKGYNFGTMPNAPVIAATFSKDVAHTVGQHYGEEALWCGNSIIWGSAGQLHRNAYGGRTHEYYSEDPMLTCFTNEEVIVGSREMGLINGPKHLAFNNSEYCRYGISTFFNEQAARENELRAFQGGFEDGGALGVMGGYNRVGITYSNAHTGLMQNILRGEWGFKGILSTDMADHIYMQSLAECVLGGTTMMANSADSYTDKGKIWNYASADNIKDDSALLETLQQNMKYQWYAYANSSLMNGVSQNSVVVNVMTWWRAVILAVIIISAAGLALSLVGYTVESFRKERK